MHKSTLPPRKNQKAVPLNALLAWAENLLLWSAFGALPPLLGFLAGWWGSVFHVAEENVIWYALGGLALGVTADVLFLRGIVRAAYRLPWCVPMFVYLFYAVGMFGLFMGVPVFNVLLGALAGFYSGRRAHHSGLAAPQAERLSRLTALFAAGVLALACTAALVLAACSSSTPADIAGLLGLGFTPTMGAILGVSAVLGILLVAFEYIIATIVFRVFLRS